MRYRHERIELDEKVALRIGEVKRQQYNKRGQGSELPRMKAANVIYVKRKFLSARALVYSVARWDVSGT